jgi:hypothetical protein
MVTYIPGEDYSSQYAKLGEAIGGAISNNRRLKKLKSALTEYEKIDPNEDIGKRLDFISTRVGTVDPETAERMSENLVREAQVKQLNRKQIPQLLSYEDSERYADSVLSHVDEKERPKISAQLHAPAESYIQQGYGPRTAYAKALQDVENASKEAQEPTPAPKGKKAPKVPFMEQFQKINSMQGSPEEKQEAVYHEALRSGASDNIAVQIAMGEISPDKAALNIAQNKVVNALTAFPSVTGFSSVANRSGRIVAEMERLHDEGKLYTEEGIDQLVKVGIPEYFIRSVLGVTRKATSGELRDINREASFNREKVDKVLKERGLTR